MTDKRKSTDNNSGVPDSELVLPMTVRNRERAEQVDNLLKSGEATTRRAARKMLLKREGRR